MSIHRRSFLGALAGVVAAPAVIRTPGLLMPVRKPALLWPGWQPNMILMKLEFVPAGGLIWVKHRPRWGPWTPARIEDFLDTVRTGTGIKS